MKKLLSVLLLILVSLCLYAEEEAAYDLSLKFKENETVKSYAKIYVNGQHAMINSISPFQSMFDGIMTEKTKEITKEKTVKKIISYDFKDIKTSEQKAAETVKPKTIGFEIDSKGKLYSILDGEGKTVQKIKQSDFQFPEKPVKVGDSWTSINSISGVALTSKSTLKEVKEINKAKCAVIAIEIDTPVDINIIMQLIGVTSATLGAYDQLQFVGYCKGVGEITLDLDKGQIIEEKIDSVLSYQGGMWGQIAMQGQFKVQSHQKIFTAEDYKKYEPAKK